MSAACRYEAVTIASRGGSRWRLAPDIRSHADVVGGETHSSRKASRGPPDTGSHVSGGPRALGDCCSEAMAERSGSDGQVAAWASGCRGNQSRVDGCSFVR